ncbi:hypothetical protein E1B28_007893 [Marasmius oreades]|nr:uncharacterized protein E1B28_007893 [Marasmius oreades]KAG7094290.1 hypothetical protein E1B28_007893 [Marasmius oreades]
MGDTWKSIWTSTTNLTSCLMNVIANSTLIHRCYIICNSRRALLYPLALIAFVLNGTNFGCIIALTVGINKTGKHFSLDFVLKAEAIKNGAAIGLATFQIGLAFITAGRIWWITREARLFMGTRTQSRYTAIVAIIMESGLLYAASLVYHVISQIAVAKWSFIGRGALDPVVIVILMSGIAPTMVNVRIAYGKSIDSVDQVVSTLDFAAERGNENQRISFWSGAARQSTFHTIDLQSLGVQHNIA